MELKDMVREAVVEVINEELKQDNSFVKQLKERDEQRQKVLAFKEIIRNGGRISNGKKISMKDLLTSSEFSHTFPLVIEEIAGEVWENQLVITPFLEEMTIDPGPSLTIEVPQFEGVFGQNLDVGEAGEYPELKLSFGAGAVGSVTIGKQGIAVSMTEEAIKFSRYDILNAALNEAMKALARWKEQKAVRMFKKYAQVVKTGGSGVGIDGQANNGLTLEDLIEVMVKFMELGFEADTIIMNPLAYPIFTLNGTLRSFFFASLGEQGQFYKWPQTNGMTQPDIYEKMGKTRNLMGRNIASFELPTGLLGKPLRLILSPAVPYDAQTKKTDIYIFDSTNVGYLITAERPTTDEFNDPMHDIRKFKIRERYGMAPKFGGAAIGIIKDVSVVETFDPRPFWVVNK